LHYGKKDGRLSIAATFASVGNFVQILKRNAETITHVIDDFHPDIVVTDSVYTFKPMKKRKIPIVSLNNADVVYKAYFRIQNKPWSILPQFYMVELMDYLYHKFVPNAVVSPTLDQSLPKATNTFNRIGPIVRKGVLPTQTNKIAKKVVIMLSGSTFSSELVFRKKSYPFKIEVVGRAQPEGVPHHPDITYHGKLTNSLEVLNDADLLLVNGGFSAVSEGFVLKKPLLVIPVPNHAEQWINARVIEMLGVGMMCTEENFEDVMFKALDQLSQFVDAYDQLPQSTNAADDAAKIILGVKN